MPTNKLKAKGRCGNKIDVPCNWNVQGRCGVDTKPCSISFYVSSH
jgi:hypothetical protein